MEVQELIHSNQCRTAKLGRSYMTSTINKALDENFRVYGYTVLFLDLIKSNIFKNNNDFL